MTARTQHEWTPKTTSAGEYCTRCKSSRRWEKSRWTYFLPGDLPSRTTIECREHKAERPEGLAPIQSLMHIIQGGLLSASSALNRPVALGGIDGLEALERLAPLFSQAMQAFHIQNGHHHTLSGEPNPRWESCTGCQSFAGPPL